MISIEKVDGEWPEWAIYACGFSRIQCERILDRLAAVSVGEKVVWDAGLSSSENPDTHWDS